MLANMLWGTAFFIIKRKTSGGLEVMKNLHGKKYNIAVAGTGYVGLSIAVLLSQHNHVTAVDIIPEKVEMINNRKSPIQDEYIEKYLAEKELDMTATLNTKQHTAMRISSLLQHLRITTARRIFLIHQRWKQSSNW